MSAITILIAAWPIPPVVILFIFVLQRCGVDPFRREEDARHG